MRGMTALIQTEQDKKMGEIREIRCITSIQFIYYSPNYKFASMGFTVTITSNRFRKKLPQNKNKNFHRGKREQSFSYMAQQSRSNVLLSRLN